MTDLPPPPAAFFEDAFATGPVMGILRGFDPGGTVARCERAWDLGIRMIEVPVQDPAALPSLRAAVAAGRERGLPVGAGTVLTAPQVGEVVTAGAAFAVSPGLVPEVAGACGEHGLPLLPGVATAGEIAQALARGLSWLKVFPAAQLTPDWVRAQRGPFPAVPLVATGGVDAYNAQDYLAAGCRAVGVGTALEDPQQLELLAELMRG
ncbi:bifunctional 4-hydroxy-2-oxoglutarate aldolase/2-dehydro-3-deoxy-phosphogluconate aldolase [Streptomyces sp. NPDC059853]|uniref:bifunctional 4-hydroxy-2-oxoglutarate aldolase/2-dehydro-3-deoxy-phosphogluconate aldolase n=1 Tax=Streptomyces sp. NPDC059853 TaxID=3346973 RepID=UPI0036602CC7